MTIKTIFPFDDPSEYAYDANKIEIINGYAILKRDSTSTTKTNDFDTDSGLTYDVTLEVSGSRVWQRDMTPSGVLMSATYDNGMDADFGSGSTTANPLGSVYVDEGKAWFVAGGGDSYIDYYPDTFPVLSGTVRVGYVPLYDGWSDVSQYMIHVGDHYYAYNEVEIVHANNGRFMFLITNEVGQLIYTNYATANTYSLSSGTLYDIQVSFNGSGYAAYLDGVLIVSGGLDPNASGSRTSLYQDRIRVGNDRIGTKATNFAIDYFQVYDREYIDFSTDPFYRYRSGTASFTFDTSGALSIESFTSNDAEATYTINGLYWDGTGWAPSNGSRTQSNPASILNQHVDSFTPTDTLRVSVLFTNTNIVRGWVDAVSVTYSYGPYFTDAPSISNRTAIPFDGFYELGHSADVPSGTDIRYALYLDSGYYWWDGSGWALSNCTYEQASTLEEINSNIAGVSGMTGTGRFYAFLSGSADATPKLYEVYAVYSYHGPDYGDLNICTVYGYVTDVTDTRRGDVFVRAVSSDLSVASGTSAVVVDITKERRCDPNGYWEFDLIPSPIIHDTTYEFNFIYPDGRKKKYTGIYVPNDKYVRFTDLL